MSNNRRKDALNIRIEAAELAYARAHPTHIANGDEQKYAGDNKFLASFTKGLPHDFETGLIRNEKDFRYFIHAIKTGEPVDFVKTPLGPNGDANDPSLWRTDICAEVRAWESQGAGHTFDLEGPDAQSVTMPPAPKLGSHELTAEMAEVYSQATLRDIPFNAMLDSNLVDEAYDQSNDNNKHHHLDVLNNEKNKLNCLPWFDGSDMPNLTNDEISRRRTQLNNGTVFRGQTKGDDVGPYISQFLLAGDKGLDGEENPKQGRIHYGSIRINQRVRTAIPEKNYMQTWDEWFDVQNGAAFDQKTLYVNKENNPTLNKYRFITTPRDLATYVHNDALYEAYLNACLLLLNNKNPFDPNIPFQDKDKYDHQQGFAHFGGPHILSLLTEVATRALKAVRFQKFNIHRRMRPEVLAARLEKRNAMPDAGKSELVKMYQELDNAGYEFGAADDALLLPMAFPEGSPMHPSYGAGHATVAGACVTILKAFFDHSAELDLSGSGSCRAFIPTTDGKKLIKINVAQPLTVEGELNKLASNIAIGRDWAGVHYYTDYIESLKMGEKIALGILEEQKLTYNETFSMTVPLFDGGTVTI
jgi:hypothetical protein